MLLKENLNMLTRQLGRSGIRVSAIGVGTWAIGGPWTFRGVPAGWGEVIDEDSRAALQTTLEMGINFIDTAPNYGCGHSERLVGEAIAGKRDKVIVATKFGYNIDERTKAVVDRDDVPGAIREECEESLKRLQTEYIDLYQLHVWDLPVNDAARVRDVLEALVRDGKIRSYGWSTDDLELATVFSEGPHCSVIQHRMNVLEPADRMVSFCKQNGLAGVIRGPLLRAILTGKFTPDTEFPENDVRGSYGFGDQFANLVNIVESLREALAVDGRTVAQGALSWLLARSDQAIPIPGFKTTNQVKENAGVLSFGPLSDSQMEEIECILDGTAFR